MADKARLFKIDDQPPLIQLIVASLIVIIAGTLLFYFFIFAGSLFFRTEMREMLLLPSTGIGAKENMIIRYVQFVKQLSLFIIPSLIIIYLVKKDNGAFLGAIKLPDFFTILLVIILSLLIIPITSYTGILNSKMDLPDWLSEVESWMKAKEDTAADLTKLLITSKGLAMLFVNIIILAVVPAIGEELLFRGVLQQLLSRIFRSRHLGIWIASIIFSGIHLQFFGFIPRLILGLSFGYLFYWSRNLWVPVIAHFVNNVVLIILAYYVSWEEMREKAINLKVHVINIPFIPIIFAIAIFYYFRSEYRKKLNGESDRAK